MLPLLLPKCTADRSVGCYSVAGRRQDGGKHQKWVSHNTATPPLTPFSPDDGEKLYRDYGILASNLVELGAFAHRADATFVQTYTRSIVALAKVVAHYTGKTLDKGKARSSNWETAPLSEEQFTCAFCLPLAE